MGIELPTLYVKFRKLVTRLALFLKVPNIFLLINITYLFSTVREKRWEEGACCV